MLNRMVDHYPPLVDQIFDDPEAYEWWNPDVIDVLAELPLGIPFTAADIAAKHPGLPTENSEDENGSVVVSIWDTLGAFVDHGERLFRQIDEPFGAEWVRVGCCYDHYQLVWPGRTPTFSEEDLADASPQCQNLWAQWRVAISGTPVSH